MNDQEIDPAILNTHMISMESVMKDYAALSKEIRHRWPVRDATRGSISTYHLISDGKGMAMDMIGIGKN